MPKKKAKELYRYAQEREEEWRTKKRARNIEAARASSGASSIVVGQTSGSHMKSKLLELKQLLEEELITQDEYYKKKNEFLFYACPFC